ncbi:DEAD/DEAH box helicase [Pontivivens insulae]|uniref:DEAD-box ATP-dependent RNA helicase CshA n=1 Tax=Pontivivens insulae TaxID=1639689 RepID=A0A2R8ABK0_9RHOB|nr:DEAD/DEAH box helicase [Pontivivens insulae]RED11397.1 ATP-dependent RNA helicase DeaD [Pontivivens insulae]SPF29430.1 DEAD-box ATP-dependent RNA helicase CshA [Pontivivens insulae]
MKKALADALAARGYETLTPVQEAVTEAHLTGKDMLVSAQTGSGKTVGFGLAIAPTLLGEDDAFGASGAPLALVIAPTRELALQVKRELGWLYRDAGAFLASTVGGMDMRDERRALARGAHIVVATPGRLRDHIQRGSIDLSDIRAIVLDEADEMLDLGFREDLEFILGSAPEDRQTLLFSATVPKSIAKLAESYQRDAVRVVTKSEATQHADIEYHAYSVSNADAENAIINTLRLFEAPNAIVFANTRAMVNRITTRLTNRGFPVVALSGELNQAARTAALQSMRDGRARVCVATDVAARGIDLPNLDLVVHAELPSSHETLLHRSGRTGRAGRKGTSVLIVPPKAFKKAQRILKFAKLKAEWGGAPSADAVRAADEQRMLSNPVWQEPIPAARAESVAHLVEAFSPEQIANAYLELFHAKHSAPEELSGVEEKPRERAPFGPSVWFSVAGGRKAGAEPRRMLPMLCKAGNVSREDIGAIRVQYDQTFVEIRDSSVDRFTQAIGADMTVEGGASIMRLDSAPDLGQRPPRPTGRHPNAERSNAQRREPRPRPAEPIPEGEAQAPKPKISTQPTDWNDAPTPRKRKPKPEDRKAKPAKPAEPRHPEGAVIAKRRVPEGERKGGGWERPKGPPPPKGKKNSKKNKARAAAAKAEARGKRR